MSFESREPYCQYIEKVCTEIKSLHAEDGLFFAYPSQPETSADAIQKAIELIRADKSLPTPVIDWKDLPIEGNIILCEICKAIRGLSSVVINTTYVNFNVLFEYGLAVGSRKAIWPLVETGVSRDKLICSNIKSITTIGYSQFSNGSSIYKKIIKKKPWTRTSHFNLPQALGREPTREATGILYIKSMHNNEPSLRISETLSTLKLGIITDDPNEVPFRHMTWYLNQIGKAYAVIIHLGSERMAKAHLHWAKCALVAGVALALGRRLLMIGENITFEPIDYRDLLRNYKNAREAETIVQGFLSTILPDISEYHEYMEHDIKLPVAPKGSIWESADLGDYVAENEQNTLEDYFIQTPEFLSALEPRFKVFVGRKGSGKTANYYMICNRLLEDRRNVVCMIKPKEYELNELLQFVKNELDAAKKGYLLESLWKFMLYSESLKSLYDKTIKKPVEADLLPYEKSIKDYFESSSIKIEESFTTRLVQIVRNLCHSFPQSPNLKVAVSEMLHSDQIKHMHKMLCEYVENNAEHFAILIDGLDANWRLTEDYEIMSDILLALIGAAKDMWRDCSRDINKSGNKKGTSVLIFVRSDVFRVALARARDPDKLQYDTIFWPDVDSLVNVVVKRLMASIEYNRDEIFNWKELLAPGFTHDAMKNMLVTNILPRPRDFIYYFQRVIYYARVRGTKYLTKRDFQSALDEYSQYVVLSLSAEAQPFIPNMLDLLLEFDESKGVLSLEEINNVLSGAGVDEKNFRKALDFLVEINFLGYGIDDYNYRFPVSPADDAIMLKRFLRHAKRRHGVRRFKIHNAFHQALNIQ